MSDRNTAFCRPALAALLTLAAPTIALAQAEAARERSDIVVTARSDPEPTMTTVQRQARAISRAVNIREQPLGRFQAPVCPGIIGLHANYAPLMIDRIRQLAGQAGISLNQEDGCRPNLVVVFAEDGRSEIAGMARKGYGPLAQLTPDQRRELAADTGPVHAWSVTTERTRDGMNLSGAENFGQIPQAWVQSGNSLILLATRLDIDISVVVIDIAATEGMTLVQLADYAAMRGLVETRPPEGDTAFSTILTLFHPGERAPGEATAFDIGYLRSAYSPIANLPAFAKLSGVTREMRAELAAAETGEGKQKP